MNTKCLCPQGGPVRFIDDVTGRGFCSKCASQEITSSANVHLQYTSQLLGYEVGERVDCWTAARWYDGSGTVIEVSTDLKDGGTPKHPAYLVRLDDGQELLYTGVCLRRLADRITNAQA